VEVVANGTGDYKNPARNGTNVSEPSINSVYGGMHLNRSSLSSYPPEWDLGVMRKNGVLRAASIC